ncbi:ribosomal protein S7 domain-containing protein, partial [Paraphysoderma sedebokerense]
DPLITQAVNLLMRHGEKSKAQNLINKTFIELRNKSNRNPSDLFAKAVELAAPLVECTSFKRGSKVLQIPKALTERQKNRRGILWILEAAGKRSDKQFEKRLANEVLAVLDGSSGVIAKKQQIYKTALANRTNVSIKF